jgi:hypothetical protein
MSDADYAMFDITEILVVRGRFSYVLPSALILAEVLRRSIWLKPPANAWPGCLAVSKHHGRSARNSSCRRTRWTWRWKAPG